MRTIITVIFTLLCCGSVVAQELEDDYRLYKIDAVEFQDRIIETDTTIFYRVAHARRDLYDEVTAYRFSHVDFARRGHYYTDRKATLNGLEVRHANLSVMRRLGLSERGYAGIAHGRYHVGGAVGMDEFTTMDGVPISGVNVGAFLSGKGYLGGMRATIDAMMSRGWSATFHVAARGGDDLYVKGVYNNSVDAGLRIAKTFDSGAAFSLVALATVGDKGLRSGSTDEAFTLVGDNLYNPAWGYQAGKERTSRRRIDAVPFVAATYYVPIGNTTQMTLSLGGDYGHRKYSTLGWYDAMTPRPDNYRYMPSYFNDEEDIFLAVESEWLANNPRYTQIDFDRLIMTNRLHNGEATYAISDRVITPLTMLRRLLPMSGVPRTATIRSCAGMICMRRTACRQVAQCMPWMIVWSVSHKVSLLRIFARRWPTMCRFAMACAWSIPRRVIISRWLI